MHPGSHGPGVVFWVTLPLRGSGLCSATQKMSASQTVVLQMPITMKKKKITHRKLTTFSIVFPCLLVFLDI